MFGLLHKGQKNFKGIREHLFNVAARAIAYFFYCVILWNAFIVFMATYFSATTSEKQ